MKNIIVLIAGVFVLLSAYCPAEAAGETKPLKEEVLSSIYKGEEL